MASWVSWTTVLVHVCRAKVRCSNRWKPCPGKGRPGQVAIPTASEAARQRSGCRCPVGAGNAERNGDGAQIGYAEAPRVADSYATRLSETTGNKRGVGKPKCGPSFVSVLCLFDCGAIVIPR
jgi:hypothetical protein